MCASSSPSPLSPYPPPAPSPSPASAPPTVRYPTAGSSSPSEAQPFYVNSPYGIVLAHVRAGRTLHAAHIATLPPLTPHLRPSSPFPQNGNLTNAKELSVYMEDEVHRHINTDSDSEVLLNILANNLQQTGKHRVTEEDIFTAIASLHQSCRGGYACVGMITGAWRPGGIAGGGKWVGLRAGRGSGGREGGKGKRKWPWTVHS